MLLGDTCVPKSEVLVHRDVCCENIGQGCGAVEEFPPQYVEPSSCLNDDCSMCSLSFYGATNYFDVDGVLLRRIIDYAGGIMQDTAVNNKESCCDAGIQLNNADLIKACIRDGVLD